MYNSMPKPNVEQLAKTIAVKNKTLPKGEERIGTGSEENRSAVSKLAETARSGRNKCAGHFEA
jgi:hypothetical protein